VQALANFTMRGRSQAVLVAAACALLSLIVPLVGLISSGAVALVTLRQGPAEGLIVGAFAGLASGLLAFVALGSPIPAMGFALALWLPVWALSVVLRQSRSLDLTIQLAAIFGFLIVAAIHFQAPDPAVYWAELFGPVRENLVASGVVDEVVSEDLVARISRWMTGAFAATFYFQLLLALFIGRWWQALLFNPGGFGEEFRAFRVRPAVGYLALALLVLLPFTGGALWAMELLLLLAPLFFFQGVAIMHGIARARRANRGWLIGFYALLLLFLPHAEIFVAAVGFVDVWANLRARVTVCNKG
jgi:hypothetical protein